MGLSQMGRNTRTQKLLFINLKKSLKKYVLRHPNGR